MRVGEVSYFAQEAEGLFGDEGLFGFGEQKYASWSGDVVVRSKSGDYIPGAQVYLINAKTNEPYGSATTDEGGFARFSGVAVNDPPGLTPGALAYRVRRDGIMGPQIIPAALSAEAQLLEVDALPKNNWPEEIAPVASKGIPTAALAIGGVAILGVLAFAFFKK